MQGLKTRAPTAVWIAVVGGWLLLLALGLEVTGWVFLAMLVSMLLAEWLYAAVDDRLPGGERTTGETAAGQAGHELLGQRTVPEDPTALAVGIAQIRRRRRYLHGFLVGSVAGSVAFLGLASRILGEERAAYLGERLGLLLLFAGALVFLPHLYSRCPRCGKFFYIRFGTMVFREALARSCVSCGLDTR